MTNLLPNAIVRHQVAKKAGQSAARWRCVRGGGAQPNSRAVNLRSREGEGVCSPPPLLREQDWRRAGQKGCSSRTLKLNYSGRERRLCGESSAFGTWAVLLMCVCVAIALCTMYNVSIVQLHNWQCNALAVCDHSEKKHRGEKSGKRKLLTRWYCAVLLVYAP